MFSRVLMADDSLKRVRHLLLTHSKGILAGLHTTEPFVCSFFLGFLHLNQRWLFLFIGTPFFLKSIVPKVISPFILDFPCLLLPKNLLEHFSTLYRLGKRLRYFLQKIHSMIQALKRLFEEFLKPSYFWTFIFLFPFMAYYFHLFFEMISRHVHLTLCSKHLSLVFAFTSC